MRERPRWLGLLFLLLALTPDLAQAVPAQVPYHGVLTNEDGDRVTDYLTIEVGLYGADEGGIPLWGPAVFANVLVEEGDFSIVLGEPPHPPLGAGLLTSETLWLDFSVNGQPLKPRQQVLSVPFALQASDAHRLGGVDAEAFLTYDDVDTASLLRTGEVGEAARTNRYEDLEGLPDLEGLLRADGTVPLTGAWDVGGHPLSGVVIAGGLEAPEASGSGALWFDAASGHLAVHDGSTWRLLDGVATGVECSGCVDLEDLGFQLSELALSGSWTDLEGAPVLSEYLRADGATPMTSDLDLAGHSLLSAHVEAVPSSDGLSPSTGRLILDQAQGRMEMGDGNQWVPVTGALSPDGVLDVSEANISGDAAVDGTLSTSALATGNLIVEGALQVGGVDMADAVALLGDEVASSHAALVAAESRLWCLEHCATIDHPCRITTCDGVAGSCQIEGNAADGAPCGGGLGICGDGTCCLPRTCAESGVACGTVDDGCGGTVTCSGCGDDEVCEDGKCLWNQTTCGGVTCPEISAYDHQCNVQEHCEYRRRVLFEPWQAHDVWIYVPPGTFPMGQTESDPVAFLWNLPSHEVSLSEGYFVGRLEVTVAIHEACEADGACATPTVDANDLSVDPFGLSRSANGRGAHPQNGLTRAGAATVCGWLGGRLPSEAEWEYAATGATHRVYPWGDTPPPSCAAGNGAFALQGEDQGLGSGTTGCGSDSTYPVGSTPSGLSATGASDMAGNLLEWTEDCWHDSYNGAPTDGSPWLDTCDADVGVVRGSHYRNTPNLSALAIRIERDADAAGGHVGVRCVR